MKNNKKKRRSKSRFGDPIKNCVKLTANLLKADYKSNFGKFKFDEDPLQRRVYFLSFINSHKIVLSQFLETKIMLMDYPFIRGEDFPEYAKKAIWNLFHAYKYAHSQILNYEYQGDGIQALSMFQSQCANMTFAEKISYNKMF